MWKYTGTERPPFAVPPEPGQESVWDYPRPPALVRDPRTVTVYADDILVARSSNTVRILETASPPTFYIPFEDVNMELLVRSGGSSMCEWKGAAQYWTLKDSPARRAIGWSYPAPRQPFESIQDALSFYPGRVSCFVDDELVRPQAGGFYGGWITDEIVGPMKGDPGTGHW